MARSISETAAQASPASQATLAITLEIKSETIIHLLCGPAPSTPTRLDSTLCSFDGAGENEIMTTWIPLGERAAHALRSWQGARPRAGRATDPQLRDQGRSYAVLAVPHMSS